MTEAKKEFDFTEFLTELDHGRTLQRINEDMRKVVAAVEETGLVGELTLKFKVSKDGGMAQVIPDLTHKAPTHKLHGTLFYFAADGAVLAKEDPKQLKLRNLRSEPTNVRVLPAPAPVERNE